MSGISKAVGALLVAVLAVWALRPVLEAPPLKKTARADAGAHADWMGAVTSGLTFLRRNKSDISALIVLDYLQRKYALPADLAFEKTYSGRPGENDKLRLWGRLVGQAPPMDEGTLASLKSHSATDPLVAPALYCDRFALPPGYSELLYRSIAHGGYELTHASLALELIDDNGCARASEYLDARNKARMGMLLLVYSRPPDPRYAELDVTYEALALLADFSQARDLDDQPFVKILAAQQPDGGWRPQPDRPTHPHPTVLAVWALLARARPDAPHIPFARQ